MSEDKFEKLGREFGERLAKDVDDYLRNHFKPLPPGCRVVNDKVFPFKKGDIVTISGVYKKDSASGLSTGELYKFVK